MAKQTRYAVPIKCIALAALLTMAGPVLDAAEAPGKDQRGLSLRSSNTKKIQEQNSDETIAADHASALAGSDKMENSTKTAATEPSPTAQWSVQARPAKGSGEGQRKDGRSLSLRSKKVKRLQEQNSTANANPDLWAMQPGEPYGDPFAASPEPVPEPYGSGAATGQDEYVTLSELSPLPEPPLAPYTVPEIDYYIPQPLSVKPQTVNNAKSSSGSGQQKGLSLRSRATPGASDNCEAGPRKGLRLRRSRDRADCATGAITVPSVAVNVHSVSPQYSAQYVQPGSPSYQVQPRTSGPGSGTYPEPLPSGLIEPPAQPGQAKTGHSSDDDSYYDKYHNVITDNPHDQEGPTEKKTEQTVQDDENKPSSENDIDHGVIGKKNGSRLSHSDLSGASLPSDTSSRDDQGEPQSRRQDFGDQPTEPPAWQMPPPPPPQPTREEVEDYRQRLELRLLERYNNLPEHAGNVGRVEVLLSRTLEVSLDGSRIKAEFDQLVYDPWGRRIPKLEEEYFVVTFAAGGARQVRSDPSVRVGLDHEQGFSERMPLNADPFAKVPESKAFTPAPKPAKATRKMADWWRPDFPELQ